MDSSGRIHALPMAELFVAEAQLRELEKRVGKVVPIPPEELETVKAMPVPERKAWYAANLTKQERNARKATRRRQREARKAQHGKR